MSETAHRDDPSEKRTRRKIEDLDLCAVDVTAPLMPLCRIHQKFNENYPA
jgi:hypothetical protein